MKKRINELNRERFQRNEEKKVMQKINRDVSDAASAEASFVQEMDTELAKRDASDNASTRDNLDTSLGIIAAATVLAAAIVAKQIVIPTIANMPKGGDPMLLGVVMIFVIVVATAYLSNIYISSRASKRPTNDNTAEFSPTMEGDGRGGFMLHEEQYVAKLAEVRLAHGLPRGMKLTYNPMYGQPAPRRSTQAGGMAKGGGFMRRNSFDDDEARKAAAGKAGNAANTSQPRPSKLSRRRTSSDDDVNPGSTRAGPTSGRIS